MVSIIKPERFANEGCGKPPDQIMLAIPVKHLVVKRHFTFARSPHILLFCVACQTECPCPQDDPVLFHCEELGAFLLLDGTPVFVILVAFQLLYLLFELLFRGEDYLEKGILHLKISTERLHGLPSVLISGLVHH